ncbi:MAG: hypothetical protein ACTSRI_00605 [Promethearchaeota archaeon]
MADFHTKSFFGQSTGIIVNSPAKTVPHIFITCIKKKDDNIWEKPTNGEGKTVKLSIEEIICILEVLKRKSSNWRGYHVFKDEKTEIMVGWEDSSLQVLLFKIGNYTKKLRFPNTKFLMLFLDHILTEKIEFATSGTFKIKVKAKAKAKQGPVKDGEYGIFSENIFAKDGLQVIETTEYDALSELLEIEVKIKVESPKALLIVLNSGHEFWIPKSTLHSHYNVKEKENFQKLIIDKWIIEKQKII